MDVDNAILELTRIRRNGIIYGLLLIVLGGASLLGILSIFQPSGYYVAFVFVFSMGIIFAGIIYLFYVGDTANNLLRSVNIMRQIEPDELVVNKKFVLGRKEGIYLLTKRTAYMLSLIRFDVLLDTNEKKIRVKLPKTKFGRSKKIAGVKVYYSKGRYTIPISQDKYATGNGVMYSFDTETFIPTFVGPPITHSYNIKKEKLLVIMDELKKEII